MSFKDFKKSEPVKAKEEVKEDISKKAEEPVHAEPVEKSEDITELPAKEPEEVKETKKEEPKTTKYVVVVDMLNVRKTPNGDILKQIKSGDVIEGEPENPEWIKLSNGEGYIMSQFVAPKKG